MPGSYRILLVDDSRDTVEALEKVLRRRGFRIDCAANGRRAIALLHSREYDLLITDLRMPQPDGLQLAAYARKLRPGIRIVLVTAYSNMYDHDQFQACGVELELTKPFDPAYLLQTIEQMLRRPRATARVASPAPTDQGTPPSP